MKILIVEDEARARAYLRKGLAESGFTVDVAETGADAFHLATTQSYDLIVLDVTWPGGDGSGNITSLRQRGVRTLVLMISACDQVQDRVKGLELGADDYLVKPFAFSELLARVRSLLRRAPSSLPETVRVADLEIDFVRVKAFRAGKRLELTPKEFSLLSLFARRRGQVLSRTLIMEQVWDMNFDGDSNVVDVHIRRLRGKLDDPFPAALLHTVRGRGYILEERR